MTAKYGHVVPRIEIDPGVPDKRFLTLRFDGTSYEVDAHIALTMACEILSVMPRTSHLTGALTLLKMYKPPTG
jgi:hypothetical protein